MAKLAIDGVEIAQIDKYHAQALIQMANGIGGGIVADVAPFQYRRNDFDIKASELGLSVHHAAHRHYEEWETTLRLWFRAR